MSQLGFFDGSANQLDLFVSTRTPSYGDDFDHRRTRTRRSTGERIERAPDKQVPNDYIAGLSGRKRVEGVKACGCDQPHDFIIDPATGRDETAERCRMEDPDRPNVGDLIKPGMIVETSYDTGPYMVGRVTSYMLYGHYRCWSLGVIYPDRKTGEYHDDKRAQWGAINELVIDWTDGTPRIGKLFKANTDEVRILGEAVKVNRRGQAALL